MTIIFRYLFKHQLLTFTVITLVLATAIWFSQSLHLLETVINGGAPVYIFFELMGLVLPGFLPAILPIALFIALVFSYQKLTLDSELTVMNAAGISPWQLARPALCLALIAALFHLALNIDLVPRAYRAMRVERNMIRTEFAGAILRDGKFNTVNSNLTIYIKDRNGRDFLQGILIHDTRNPDTAITLTAEQGYVLNNQGSPRLIIQNGTRQERDNVTGAINWLEFKQYIVDLAFYNDNKNNNDDAPKSNERPMSELLDPPANINTPVLRNQFRAEAHQRIATPLYNIAFALAAIVTILGGEYNRRGRLGRTLLSVSIIVCLEIALLSLGNLTAKHPDLLPILYLFPLCIITLATYSVYRQTVFRVIRA